MATVAELKAKIAAIEAELIPLKAAHEAAKVITNQAQAAIDAVQAQPGRASLKKIIEAKKALAADPTNFALQQNLQDLNTQFAAQAAELAPLQAARDAAWANQVKAGGAVSAKDDEAGELDVEIAKIDPSQASPEAVAYLKETSGLPITQQSDPTIKTPTTENVQNSAPARVSDPTGTPFDDDGNLNIGWGLDENGDPVWVEDGYIDATGETVPSIQKTTTNPNDNHGAPYDDEGNLMPGWELDEDNNPVWVGTGQDNQIAIKSAPATTNTATDHGLPYDDDGNLMPGWSLDEDNNPVWVGDGFVEKATSDSAAQSREAATTNVAGSTNSALNSNPAVTVTPYKQDDWRIRLSLAGSSNYLYKIATKSDILYPLIATDGVVFPYSPQINTSYRANYDPAELTHSNYKMFFYKNSSVDDISITADFTAQDTAEANYMLAVIHFFKSATKMFYGQDTSPRAGTPPPLLYLTGYGLHQFQKHPLLLTSFSYNLPNDVDYIRAGSNAQWGGVSIAQMTSGSSTRLGSSGLAPGGVAKPAAFSGLASQDKVTYVPTKLSLTLTLSPVVTRNDISKNFSLKDYAAGKLSAKTGGGIW